MSPGPILGYQSRLFPYQDYMYAKPQMLTHLAYSSLLHNSQQSGWKSRVVKWCNEHEYHVKFAIFMCKELVKGICMPSSKNGHHSCFMDDMVNCRAMTTPQNWRCLHFNMFAGAATNYICGYCSKCRKKHTLNVLCVNVLRGFGLISYTHVATGVPIPL